MTRVAAVDLGTNSTRLLVADVVDSRVDEVSRRLQITRLGEDVDKRRRLLPLPIARVRNCLADFRRELESLGAERTLAIATSAVRDAENGEAFLGEVEWSYGFTTRLLSGHDEALLTFRGVTAGRAIEPDTLIVDVGGGSTELVLGGPDGVSFHTSLDLGCVRLTERFGDDLGPARRTSERSFPTSSPAARSASPARSRRWQHSTSGSSSTTRTACTATCSRAPPSRSSSSGWQRCRSRSGDAFPAWSRSARR